MWYLYVPCLRSWRNMKTVRCLSLTAILPRQIQYQYKANAVWRQFAIFSAL